jgi:pimeloyl-ACP methyl ester carboxylesterase
MTLHPLRLSVTGACALALGVFLIAGPAVAGVDPDNLCKDKKAKAAGKKVLDKLKAYGKDAKKQNAAKLAADLSKAESKFERAFTKAEFDGKGELRGCVTTGDATNIELTVDDFVRDMLCDGPVTQQTVTIPSGADPAETPGTSGVNNSNYPNLVTIFGGTAFSLNNATYTRFFCGDGSEQPEAVLILVPGFEGGAASFKALAENTVPRARARGIALEVWAFDRRGHQMEDRVGLKIARDAGSALAGLDWYYGGELGLTLHPLLAAGPNRRAVFLNTNTDTAFMANWTNLVFSRDIDAVVEAARATTLNQNVFLGGHSAGTGFTARYAATDLNLTGVGAPDPGYAKLRGLVLLEGGGGSSAGTPPTADALDRMEDKFDGGLFGAVRDGAPRCADGTTACTVATEAVDCAGIGNETCTPNVAAYSVVPGLLNPRILAAAEAGAIQGRTDPDGGKVIIQVDQGAPGNNAIAVVPDLATLSILPQATAAAALGSFIDDDGFISSLATFVRTSVGAPGPVVGGLLTWKEITEGPFGPSIVPDNGPPPTSGGGVWGMEAEVVRIQHLAETFLVGDTNFTDWYYPNAGPSVTAALGLNSTLLSADAPTGRGRRDIENLTQAANVDIPVICFGGSNGLTPVPRSFVSFAQSLGTCTAPSCDGSTVRVVDAANPSVDFPTLGGIAGGYEVHISEGYAHIDVVAAEDGVHNRVVGPLVDFIARNLQ